ncbi:MAG TPA: alpha/beta hydrolase [Anaerolinea sp.]|nr:alpha/beta hydrolase [Anaerolinea sp.]
MPFFQSQQHTLFYREQGTGPLLIVLPGNTASSALHGGELAYFGARYHTVSMDFLGTGQSERLEPWPDDWWRHSARDVLALIDHLDEGPAILMGTSGGAVIALWAAIFSPHQVQAVIADSTGEFFSQDIMRSALEGRLAHSPGQIAFWSDAHGEDWEQVVAADSRVIRAFGERGGDWFEGRLKEIACPTLFSASLTDDLLPRIGAEVVSMASQAPGSQAFLVNGGAHPLMFSAQAAFRAAADLFLDQVQVAA